MSILGALFGRRQRAAGGGVVSLDSKKQRIKAIEHHLMVTLPLGDEKFRWTMEAKGAGTYQLQIWTRKYEGLVSEFRRDVGSATGIYGRAEAATPENIAITAEALYDQFKKEYGDLEKVQRESAAWGL